MSTTQSPASEAPTPLPEGTARLVRNRHGALPPLVLAHDQGTARPLIEPIVIGSSPAADLRVQDIYMSGRHARIRPVEDALIIEDLGSTNGTFLDGLRVARAWLQPGSQLRLGGWHCRIQATESAASLTVSAGEHGMVGASPAFLDMLQALVRFAPLVRPVLLTGETGTGKELAARALHRESPRQGPFIALNCGAIPEGLCESELFGHVRGAFTGAHRRHAGAFERACGGTLFLDEIAELPLPLQAKLLRVLETGKIVPVGGEHEIEVDVRVVSASHQRLDRLADQGRFREDLYHRLGVFTIRVPPLRERPEDIPLLIEQFAREIGNELRRPVRFDPSTIAAAKIAAWPGNIRELRNCLFRAAALNNEPITPSRLLARTVAPHSAGEPLAETITIPRGSYAAMKRALIRRYLTEKGSIRKAARALEVPRSTFGAWLKK